MWLCVCRGVVPATLSLVRRSMSGADVFEDVSLATGVVVDGTTFDGWLVTRISMQDGGTKGVVWVGAVAA